VWNRTRAKADAFAAAHATAIADTPAEAARGKDIVITCLPSSHEVEEVVFGKHGLAEGMASGAILVDCTSGDPMASRRIADRLQTHRSVSFIDAPVSGGVSGAEQGKLTVMCGGDVVVLERVRPVLASFGSKIVSCGGVGAGHAIKAVNNTLLAIHIWSTAEGLAMLEKFGVDPAIALDVINASSGRSNTSEHLFPERVLTGAFPNTFRLALLDKDVRIAAHLARETRTPAELFELTSKLFIDAHMRLGDEADHVEAVRIVERRAGVEIRTQQGKKAEKISGRE
jgi:3-hydroxyisobutyrate dehydrogenase